MRGEMSPKRIDRFRACGLPRGRFLRHDGNRQHHEHADRGARHDDDRQRPHPGHLRRPRRPGTPCGKAIMDLHDRNILPRDIMTQAAFENALAVDMASADPPTPACIFRRSPPRRAWSSVWPIFRRRRTVCRTWFCSSRPGSTSRCDFYNAGGVAGLMKELLDHGLVHAECHDRIRPQHG